MATDLQTIRALSQYRPFESGGQSVRDAHADLVLAALAEGGGSSGSAKELSDAVTTLFRINLSELSLAAALGQLLKESRIEKQGTGFALLRLEAERLDALAAESQAIAQEAQAEWRKYLVDTWPLMTDQLQSLTEHLALFLRGVIRRHGVEASLLIYPESERCQQLYADIEKEGFDFLPASEIAEIRDTALSHFIRFPTAAQREYLSQNLNAAYFLTVLSIDPDGARLVVEVTKGQRVYADTNFVYRLLGARGPRDVKPAELILQTTQEAGYDVAVTPWTLDEFRESLKRSRALLERYPIPPSEYGLIAAAATSDENFVTAYWRQVRSGVKPQDFFEYYNEIESHLHDRGITIVADGCKAVDAQTDQITDEMSLLAKVSHGRYRHPATLEHDVKHRMLIQRLRGEGNRNFSSAGFWFLTHDSVLPRYDFLASEDRSCLPFCVSAGAWFQIVEAFRPKTRDPEQSLADMLASPYVRYRRTLSQRTVLEIVGRVDQYTGGTPELATRVFMNSAAMEEIEKTAVDEDRLAKIDDAIVVAARAAQEDARLAGELAEEERRRADEAARDAEQRAAEAERKAEAAIAAAEAARRSELADAEARRQEAIRNEEERSARALADKEERHKRELADRDTELEAIRGRAKKARRRLLFFVALVVAVVAFLLLDLAVGLEPTWSALVAIAVVVGLGIGISQWARWHSEGN